METLGVPIGVDDNAFHLWFEKQIHSHQEFINMLLRDDLSVQVALLLIRLCLIPRMGYFTRVLPPRLTSTHAASFDAIIFDTAARKLALPTPLSDEAKLQLSLPIRYSGFGLRSVSALVNVAYWCSLAQAAPDIVSIIPDVNRRSCLLPCDTQVPFARQLTNSHNELLTLEIPCGDTGVMPLDTEAFWKNYGSNRASKGLQGVLTAHLDTQSYNHHLHLSPLKDVQRLKSASARNAGAWLTCLPSSPELTMSDDDFRGASRIRLGLPYADLPRNCACGTEISTDYSHFLSCKLLRRRSMTVRHDWLVHLLAKFFRSLGAVVHIEPRIFDVDRVRPDLDIMFPTIRILSDITVVHPASPSRNSRIELSAATAAEAKKTRSYSALANHQGAKLLSYAVETYGASGKEAVELVKFLRFDSIGSIQVVKSGYYNQALSVCLQRGNVLVMNAGALQSRAASMAR